MIDIAQQFTFRIHGETSETEGLIRYLARAIEVFNEAMSASCRRGYHLLHIRLSLDEALLNAIEHGRTKDATRNTAEGTTDEIFVRVSLDSDFLEIQVADPGQGFPSDEMTDLNPKDFARILSRGMDKGKGWGLAIIRSVTHRCYWNHRGNVISLVFLPESR